jgi:PAS domain S-box-containing protein
MGAGNVDNVARRLRAVAAIGGGIYLFWWFIVELLLPGSFNPWPGRLAVVALIEGLVAASFRVPWVQAHLSSLFTLSVCLLFGHYCYLLVGNRGDATWWVGAFIVAAAAGVCLQSPRDVAVFSLFTLGCAFYAAAAAGQLRNSIYVPGLGTILLLAVIAKRSQVIAQDATVLAERARKESRKFDEQRFQLAAIVESFGDAIVASSLDGVIRSWNQGAQRLFGHVANEVIGQPTSLLLPPGREAEEPTLVARLENGERLASFESVRRRKDGSEIDVSVTISPIHDSERRLVGASMVTRDISDRKRVEAELRRAREAAEAANRELEAFNHSVAHDLREPLRAIKGFSRVLLEDYADGLDAEAQDHLRRVSDAAQHMGRLIDSMLELGNVARMSIRRQQVDLSDLARVTAVRLKESAPDRAVEFAIGDGFSAMGDRALLAAVIENLLGNAWKFTRNKPKARIEFGARQQSGQTTYFVRDNGAGFDMAFAAKLFGLFQRLHTASEFEGTGVGLATVQRIVQRHGGRVWAEGKVGEGACFNFTFGSAADA